MKELDATRRQEWKNLDRLDREERACAVDLLESVTALINRMLVEPGSTSATDGCRTGMDSAATSWLLFRGKRVGE